MAEETQEFRPLIDPSSEMKPLKQIYNGYEIEKRQLLMTPTEDHTKKKNGLTLYNEVLEEGTMIEQGYIKDIQEAVVVLQELGIKMSDFKPNTIRLRKYGLQYILTLKDRKETKKREVEFELDKKTFLKYWKLTKGARVYKKRLVKKVKGFDFEYDAFIDRFLLIAETEVTTEEDLVKVPKIGMDITNLKDWSNKCLSK